MQPRRPTGRDAVVFSTGPHWITLSPALFCLGIAGAVERWGTGPLVERLGLAVLAEEVATIDFAVGALVVVGVIAGIVVGLLRATSTRLRVTTGGVRWEQRGLGAHDVAAGFDVIDGVQVQQGILGRILGYGTVDVRGRNAIGRRRRIARPDAFRRAVEDQMSTWLCRDLGSGQRRTKLATG